ncbi:fatty acid desaturase [Methylocapsa sp. S129]|uniref:fatty acid desaturase n=1 Tax=Methylocapsa sp. S129 TaxID=1641869 RepID=UPI00131A8AF7|nr:fatty acid desaturase [Methylocapsa sp. S129]
MEIKDFPTLTPRIEWPTIALAAIIYAMWFAATLFWAHLPFWALTLVAAWTTAWHMSLQHEIIHGHPTRKRWINNLIGQWPLALWLPFENYRHSHLAHHNDERLTDPLDDPESYYWRQEDWDGLGRFGRRIVRLQSSLLGRVLIGPFWACAKLWKREIAGMAAGDRKVLREAVLHILEMIVVLIWVVGICRMPILTYLFCFAYAGTSLAMVRSFAEHRAESVVERRTAIVEKSWILGPLFLFNNLHVAHHMRHTLPWYVLPRWYQANRAALIERNGGLVYDGYFDVISRYLLRPHDQTLHPHRGSGAP